MREWNLRAGDPQSLTLAADARLDPTDYSNDQIWEVLLGGGEPPAVSISTTFGLRARNFRIFYLFSESGQTVSDPSAFPAPPVVRRFYPNLVVLVFSPFPGIQIEAEYWVPTSQTASGRLTIKNKSDQPREVQVELVAQLSAGESGEPMKPFTVEKVQTLAGKTGTLAPVVILTPIHHASASPFPSLAAPIILEPGAARQITWIEAALETLEDSFKLAQETAARNRDAERARIQLVNSRQVEIHTGDPAWDTAFSLSQKIAFGLIFRPETSLPHPSFVLTRVPDMGYSMRGNGSDYNHLWNGQTVFDAYYLSQVLLQSAPQVIEGVLKNFLATETENGFIDWKPGMGGQRTQLLAVPLLASLAERVFENTGDLDLLREVYPRLLAFVRRWINRQHDRDGDGIPEWSHPMQSGFEDNPLFAQWHTWAQGADITAAESPALCAFLYRECQTLLRFASLIGAADGVEELQIIAENQRTAVEIAWDSKLSIYHYWDRDSHFSTLPEALGERQGPGEIVLGRSFDQPVRLLIRIEPQGEANRQVQAFIHGSSSGGKHLVERVTSDQFHWYIGRGSTSSDRVYQAVERIAVEGIGEGDRIYVQTVGYTCLDHTLLLPLWAHIPDPERARALVKKTITNPKRFWSAYGLPACVDNTNIEAAGICQVVHLPWNALICEGLLHYGYATQAAELFGHMMSAIIQTLKKEKAFRKHYHALTGLGIGERNSLQGLAPVSLFLEILGVRFISAHQVHLEGFNPFSWPVTVKYLGMTVLRQAEKTVVIFPDGQTQTITDPAPCTVSLE